jgi:hypothetical protein
MKSYPFYASVDRKSPSQGCDPLIINISLLINGQNLQKYEHLCAVFLLTMLTINLSVILFGHDISTSIQAPARSADI